MGATSKQRNGSWSVSSSRTGGRVCGEGGRTRVVVRCQTDQYPAHGSTCKRGTGARIGPLQFSLGGARLV